MTSVFFNSSSNNHSPYPSCNPCHEDHLHSNHQFVSHNNQSLLSSKSLSTHLFLNSNDQNGIFHRELQPPQHQHEGNNHGSQPYNNNQFENNNGKGVEFSTSNKNEISNMKYDLNQVKWMSSKMRVMLKMKKSYQVNPNTSREIKKVEDDHKQLNSPMEETFYDISSNNISASSNNNIPIRVCSDCNTTKTPLWRSGPQGPKSLCNACGIRQRKARRAMAAAAAAANGDSNLYIDHQIKMKALKVTKTKHKDHKKPLKGQVTKYKQNRQYSKHITTITPPESPSPSLSWSTSPSPSPSPSSSSPARKNCVEDFLVSFSKNLTLYHVFPQDEKEAAILLMALSCGYAHET